MSDQQIFQHLTCNSFLTCKFPALMSGHRCRPHAVNMHMLIMMPNLNMRSDPEKEANTLTVQLFENERFEEIILHFESQLLSENDHCCSPTEDQTSNLLWRQQHGEVFLKHPPQVIILLIGTNDLGAAASCNVGEPGATTAANGTASRYVFSYPRNPKKNPKQTKKYAFRH